MKVVARFRNQPWSLLEDDANPGVGPETLRSIDPKIAALMLERRLCFLGVGTEPLRPLGAGSGWAGLETLALFTGRMACAGVPRAGPTLSPLSSSWDNAEPCWRKQDRSVVNDPDGGLRGSLAKLLTGIKSLTWDESAATPWFDRWRRSCSDVKESNLVFELDEP